MRNIIFLLLALLSLTGCHRKPSAEALFQETSTGVVVVLNAFYYEIQLPDGSRLYFNGLDENGNIEGLTPDEDKAARQRSYITGTAFFVGKHGTLMTNRHVAQPDIDADLVSQSMARLMQMMRQYLAEAMAYLSTQYDQLERQKQDCYYTDYYGYTYADRNRLNSIVAEQEKLRQKYQELDASLSSLRGNLDPARIRIRPICELGIAYNGSFVTSEHDFLDKNPCSVVRVSQQADVDLALLQLKRKQTPAHCHVFQMRGDADTSTPAGRFRALLTGGAGQEELKIDQQLYMIGYNAGLVLANTRQGIKVQMTSGKVTQLPDGQRLLYSIPTLQGSSGSPVIDDEGYLVAVNFAKLGMTDNFNFGIPAERIKEFLHP